jgi:uncharacterized protein YkwD
VLKAGPNPADPTQVRLICAFACVLALATPVVASGAGGTRSASEKKQLTRHLLSEVNTLRREHGLHPLRLSHALAAAASSHSMEMAEGGYFAHASRDGTAYWRRIMRFYPQTGYSSWSVGEDLLWESPDVTPTGAIKMWMASPPHRENLLNPAWREMGISAVRAEAAPGTFQGLTVTVVTADFAARSRTGR